MDAAARRRLPLVVHTLEAREAAALYECALVLVRPDGIVAWRGNTLPKDPGSLLDRVRGTGASASSPG